MKDWEEEFQKVNRIEPLNLPKYEDIRSTSLHKEKRPKTIRTFDDIWFYVSYEKEIVVKDIKTLEKYFNKKLNEKNYIEACFIVRDLFLGENK